MRQKAKNWTMKASSETERALHFFPHTYMCIYIYIYIIIIIIDNILFFFENPCKLHSFIKDKSKDKASRAGGGESSNHTTSSTNPLAYRANEWATELALRRIKEKDT